MKGWDYKKLDSIGDLSSSTRIYQSDYVAEGVPFYRSKEIIEKAEGKEIHTELFIEQKKYDEIKTKFGVPTTGDILITAVGTLGVVYQVKAGDNFYFKDGNLLWLRKIERKINRRYLYQLLKSKIGKALLDETAIGTSQPAYTIVNLKRIKLPIPLLSIQQKIAAVLSAYDDLIENNNRRIAILEKMAEELYREWFVRMRFPGHEKTKIVKGVPEGWSVIELSKIANEVSVGTKPGLHLESRAYLPIDLLQKRHFNPEAYLSFEEAQSSLVTFSKGDILFGAMRPYLHKVCIAPFDGVTRTTCFVIRPVEDRLYSYLYLLLFQNSTVEYATLICNGADRPYVVWNKAFERMQVYKPTEEIVDKFNVLVKPMFAKISSAFYCLENLKRSRDQLLSRLMSGMIDVEHLDIQFPASMQEELAANA